MAIDCIVYIYPPPILKQHFRFMIHTHENLAVCVVRPFFGACSWIHAILLKQNYYTTTGETL